MTSPAQIAPFTADDFALDARLTLPQREIDILTVGELLIDFISEEYDAMSESRSFQRYFGGSPSNIAMNMHSLGLRALVASAVGHDGLGQFLKERLAQAGIDTRCIQHVNEPTSLVLITKSQATPLPVFYRGADYQLAYTPEIEQAVGQTRLLHFSCWPLSMLPSRDTLSAIIHKARSLGVLIGFDPNYHPLIWQRGEEGTAIVQEMIAQADIIKPSEDDAERLFGKADPHTQLQRFLDLGAKLVLLTLGKDGVLVSNGQETNHFAARPTEVADTTGAGDAFWSGLYAALLTGHTLAEAIGCALATSAYKLRYTGAVVPLPPLASLIPDNV